MNNDQRSKINWLVILGIGLLILLLIFGYRVSNISLNLGPVSVDMEKPTEQVDLAIESEPLPQPQQSTEVFIEQQVPTAPPEPTDFNPPLLLPFSDGFDQGPDAQWRTSGNYLINNGRLAGADTVTLEIGNNSLSPYLVEFEVVSGTDFCGWNYNNYLVIGVTPTLQYRAAYTDMYSRGWWYALENGQWNELARDEIGLVANDSCSNTVRVFVNGNSYEIYANGALTTKMVYGSSTGAPFMIGTSQTPQIDNLTIRQP